ncbi:MAG: hypothetical protein AB1346_12245 [Thermodesulfobacteriota bacterium]
MTSNRSIYPVADSFGRISQFLSIRKDIATLRREAPVIRNQVILRRIPLPPDVEITAPERLPRGASRGKRMIDWLGDLGRYLLLRP